MTDIGPLRVVLHTVVTLGLTLSGAQAFGAVTIFGPKTYSVAAGKPLTVTDTFQAVSACDAAPNAVYTLVVTNGDGAGGRMVSSGSIVVNGVPIVAESDFNQQLLSLQRRLAVIRDNTIAVTVNGGKQDGAITVAIERHIDATTAVFGNKTYTTTSAATTFHDVFPSTDIAGNFSLVVHNGATDGSGQVKSGSVLLNGVEVVTNQALKAGAAFIEVPVTLRATNNLDVDLKSDTAGTFITVAIVRHLTDATPPQITIAGVVDGQLLPTTTLPVSGTITDAAGVARAILNGQPLALNATGSFATTLALTPGSNSIVVEASDCEGNTARVELHVFVDAAPPVVTITAPADGFLTNQPVIALRGTASDDTGVVSVMANGQAMQLTAGGWEGSLSFAGAADAALPITVVATDRAGKQATVLVNVIVDTTAPVFGLQSPSAEVLQYYASTVEVVGTVTDDLTRVQSVTCNGVAAPITGITYRCSVPLAAGSNTITVRAVDAAGNASTRSRTLTYVVDTTPPHIEAMIGGRRSASGWYAGPASVFFVCTDDAGAMCTPQQFLRNGAGQQVHGEALDPAGNRAEITVTVDVDGNLPAIAVDGAHERVTNTETVELTGIVMDATSGIAHVTCGTVTAAVANGRFTCSVPLANGPNPISVRAVDYADNESRTDVFVTLDRTSPTLTITSPAAEIVTNDATIEITGTAADDVALANVVIQGASLGPAQEFSHTATLLDGANVIEVAATDAAGNTTVSHVTVQRYARASVHITSPSDFAVLNTSGVTISGTIAGAVTALDVNGVPATIGGGTFTAANVPLAQGRTVVSAVAHMANGQIIADHLNLYRDSIPPRLSIYAPEADAVTGESTVAVAGMVDDIVIGTVNAGQMHVVVNGHEAAVANRAFLATGVALAAGDNVITVVATDQAGNSTTQTRHIIYRSDRPHVVAVGGNHQTAPVGGELPSLLRVRAVDAAGAAVPNVAVHCRVVQNDGTLTSGGQRGRTVTLTTDGNGEVTLRWTVGSHAGAGANRVVATAVGYDGAADFHATGEPGAPARIVIDSGNNQFGVSTERLPRPLVAIVVDAGSNRLPGVPVTFAVTDGDGSFGGQPDITVLTDTDGRAVATPHLGPGVGNDNNRFRATLANTQGAALFVASGHSAGLASETTISGVVLDNTNAPVPGVTIRLDELPGSVQTDAQGQFTIPGTPVGYVKLIVDGSTAQRSGTWPMLEFVMYTNCGQRNTIGMPIYLLPIDVTHGIQVDETHGGTLTVPEMPGFSLTVQPGSVLFPSGGRAGTISASVVHADKIPMVPAFGQQPRFVVTIQPPGTHFDPPAAVSFPNFDGLKPGEITELFSFDHDLGQFVAIGTGSVSDDATVVVSDPGVGIIKGGWHAVSPPLPTGTSSNLTVSLSVEVPPQQLPSATALRTRVDSAAARTPARIAPTGTAEPPIAVVGGCSLITAKAQPQSGGIIGPLSYAWSIVSGNVKFESACGNEPTCVVKGLSAGQAIVRVTYSAPTGRSATDDTKVRFVNLQLSLKSVSFFDDIDLYRDEPTWTVNFASTPPKIPVITDPVWKTTNLSADNNPVAYIRNTPMRAQAVFSIGIPLPVPMPGVKFEASLWGLPTLSTGDKTITIPAGATEVTVDVKAKQPLPNTTSYLEQLPMTWRAYPPSACALPVDAGFALQTVYLTLAKPQSTAYLSSVHIATSGGNATNVTQALEYTWRQFGDGLGPRDVRGWKGQPFRYYPPPDTHFTNCGRFLEETLVAKDGNALCGGLARLFVSALEMNGIAGAIVAVTPTPGFANGFLVKNWAFKTPTAVGFGEFAWSFLTKDTKGGNDMVPPYSGTNGYGDLDSVDGVPGQHASTPTQKAHSNHAIVEVGGRDLDPSYGLEYLNPSDFEAQAVAGYWKVIAANQWNVMVARQPGAGTSITFRIVE